MKRIETAIPKFINVTQTFRDYGSGLKMFPFYRQIDRVCMGTGVAMTGDIISVYVFSYVEDRGVNLLKL